MKRFLLTFVAITAIALAACTTGTTGSAKLTRDWKKPEYNGAKAKKLLIVVISKDPGLRQDLETDWVVQLVKRQISSTPSHRLIPALAGVKRDEIEAIVRREGFDAVLVARPLLGNATIGEHSNAVDWFARSEMVYYNTLYGFWDEASVGVFTMATPGKGMTQYATLRFEANFYDTRGDGTLAWTSEAEIVTARESGEARMLYAAVVLKALARHGLI